MAFQGRGMPTGSGGAPAATLPVKFWPEPFEKELQRPRRRRPSTPPGPEICAAFEVLARLNRA
jgi:hypothetical protein